MSENIRGVKLKKFIDGKEEQIYPITKTKCIFDDNGNSLDDIISNKLANKEDVDDRISKIKSEFERKVHDVYLEKKESR